MAPPVEYSFTSHFETISGVQIHYIDEGPRDVPSLFMLHGVPLFPATSHEKNLNRRNPGDTGGFEEF